MEAVQVLIVEDDPPIAAGLVKGLSDLGFEPELVATGRAAVERGLRAPPDIALLDLNLPDVSGLDVLMEWQSRASFPVVVLTARTDLDTRVDVFEQGAADYVAKPFFLEEVVARIEARLGYRQAQRPKRVVSWADVQVDLDGRIVHRSDIEVPLTPHQFNILAHLLEHRGHAVSRKRLAKRALSVDGECTPRTVDSHVARIRKALGPSAAAALVTVRAVGYRFDPTR
jgi:DNA-binding response OmpR family regulator